MKRLAFLGFTIATLMAPIQVQAQKTASGSRSLLTRKQNCGFCSLILVPVFVRQPILIWQDSREFWIRFRGTV